MFVGGCVGVIKEARAMFVNCPDCGTKKALSEDEDEDCFECDRCNKLIICI